MTRELQEWVTSLCCIGVILCLGELSPASAQNIQVTSANPSAAAQGTINLNVVIGGNGFKKGAASQWFVTGTTNPGGVTVNSTAFNSSSQLTANITISDTAVLTDYDVVVYSSGRTGKGTGLFAVTQKGTPTGCTTLGTPSGFSLVTTLNPNATYPTGFGGEIRVRPVTVSNGTSSRAVLVAAVSVNGGQTVEFFILDPATGVVLDGQSLLPGSPPQPHITVAYTASSLGFRSFAAGDVNADGIPDFVGGLPGPEVVVAFVGHMDSNGILSYQSFQFTPPPASPRSFGSGVAMGNLDGIPGDEVVIGASGASGGSGAGNGEVFIYSFNGSTFTLIDTLKDPLAPSKGTDGFGFSLAVGEVTNPLAPNLVVGANQATVNGNISAGLVYVFPAPISSPTTYFTLATGIGKDGLGQDVGAGNVNGSVDVFATTGWGIPDSKVAIFTGPITASKSTPDLVFSPDPRLSTQGWSTNFEYGDMLGDGHTELFVGVPNSNNSSSCSVSVGSAQLFFPSTTSLAQPAFTFQPLIIPNAFDAYGWGVSIVPGSTGNPALVLVGESGPGQVYIYKKN